MEWWLKEKVQKPSKQTEPSRLMEYLRLIDNSLELHYQYLLDSKYSFHWDLVKSKNEKYTVPMTSLSGDLSSHIWGLPINFISLVLVFCHIIFFIDTSYLLKIKLIRQEYILFELYRINLFLLFMKYLIKLSY